VTHLWGLYHLEDLRVAIAEAKRVLKPGGRYFTSTSDRDNDPEIMPEGYPASTFDAEEAEEIVRSILDSVVAERWDAQSFPLRTREEVRADAAAAYLDVDGVPAQRADATDGDVPKRRRWVTVTSRAAGLADSVGA
jgi:SAM-dependent methyltransferase